MLEKSFGTRTTFIFGLVTLVSEIVGALSIELHNEPSNSFDKCCIENSDVD